ncbi:glycosyltransferase [Chloroflexota bacterium]
MTRIAAISVHACPNPKPEAKNNGGMNVYLNELSAEMGRRGIEVDVFTRCHDHVSTGVEEFAANARIVHLEAGDEKQEIKELLYCHLPQFLCNLLRFTEENGLEYDLVHSHYWLSSWIGNTLKSRWQVPHVVTFHTLGEMKNRARLGMGETDLRIATEKEMIAGADRVVATSFAEKKQMTSLYEIESSKVEVIPCGVDFELFRPGNKGEAKRALGFGDSKVALYVGRIDPVKGIDLLLQVAACLKDKKDLRIIVVGGDSGDNELERLLKLRVQLGLEERVSFIDAREHRLLPLYYNAADVCLIPSYYESFCMVALEALACGTPVIASRAGHLGVIVHHGENGYLVDRHNPELFAERLELLLDNEALKRTFSAAARPSVESFRWSYVAIKMAELYGEAIRGSSSAVSPATSSVIV